jgi:hypothetical protein
VRFVTVAVEQLLIGAVKLCAVDGGYPVGLHADR